MGYLLAIIIALGVMQLIITMNHAKSKAGRTNKPIEDGFRITPELVKLNEQKARNERLLATAIAAIVLLIIYVFIL
jgi:hypothetical protein